MELLDASFTSNADECAIDFDYEDASRALGIPRKKLDNEFDSVAKSEDSMKVYLRVRPIPEKSFSTVKIESENTILTVAPDNSKRAMYTKTEERRYAFTRVFGPETSQESIFDGIASQLMNKFVLGENCTLIAYGMTNAGKTHTIQGTQKNPGIFPRLVSGALEKCANLNASLEISMMEIYQEQLFDLLSTKKDKLTLRDYNGKVEVCKLSSHKVTSSESAIKFMEAGVSNRTKSKTLLNAGSSRSHAVYTLTLSRMINNIEHSNAFQVVDLAGSERGSRAKGNAAQQKEANKINNSLMLLWRCLHGMRTKKSEPNLKGLDASAPAPLQRENSGDLGQAMIPFRESKLTHLLMPQLCQSGLSGIGILTCINPQGDDYDETLTILGNASLACKITELAEINRIPNMNRHSSISEKEVEVEHVGKKRNIEEIAGKPLKSDAKIPKENAGGFTRSVYNQIASISSTLKGGLFKGSAKKMNKGPSMSIASNTKGNNLSTLSHIDELNHYNLDESDDRSSWNMKEIVNELKAEIIRLREENDELLRDQIVKEAEIRSEVSEEMSKRSESLLQQLRELQEKVNENEHIVTDVTRSCKKIRRKQKDLQHEITFKDLKEAEEEIMRLKTSHEAEISRLNARIAELEAENSKITLAASSTIALAAPTSLMVNTEVDMQMGPEENSEEVASTFKQRLSRDHRFNNPANKRTIVVTDAGVVVIPKSKKLDQPASPGRSPLAPVNSEVNAIESCHSPIKLRELAAVQQKQQKGKPGTKQAKSKLIEIEKVADSPVNDENSPSPQKFNVDTDEQVTSNMQMSKQPAVMRRLRSTFRII